MGDKRKQYTREFKLEAVRLATADHAGLLARQRSYGTPVSGGIDVERLVRRLLIH